MKTATRPAYRPYVAVVKEARRLSPHFARITFTSPEFEVFGTDRRDQRVKLVLPGPDGRLCDIGQEDPVAIDNGEWYTRWRDLPDEERMPFRTYTVRRIDPEALELDIDFVLHHDAGPAGAWAEVAAIGDRSLVVGPDARSEESAQGIDFHPGTAQRLLLAGDETAAPAICNRACPRGHPGLHTNSAGCASRCVPPALPVPGQASQLIGRAGDRCSKVE